MRKLFASGVIGDIVRNVQTALTNAGFDTHGADGVYGQNTVGAVKGFQAANSLQASGELDDATWPSLMNSAIPSASDRSLQLTAAFEGHGFGLAMGNFDGALLTWGIIGFTMASGEVQSIILAVNEAAPQRVQAAFGPPEGGRAAQLLAIMQAPADQQKTWANSVTEPRGTLAEPWRSMFQTFGSFPEVQQEQIRHVQADYLSPAIATAKGLGFTSELGLALCFDIHVQNGGIKTAAMNQIRAAQTPGMTESDLRALVANAVADSSNPKWREDVRRRKLVVATGQGTVHGRSYILENWGLAESFDAAELTSASAQASGSGGG